MVDVSNAITHDSIGVGGTLKGIEPLAGGGGGIPAGNDIAGGGGGNDIGGRGAGRDGIGGIPASNDILKRLDVRSFGSNERPITGVQKELDLFDVRQIRIDRLHQLGRAKGLGQNGYGAIRSGPMFV